jgi:YVTN family beta-propeller protein
VLAIDTKTYTVIKNIPTGSGANELSLSPDGGILTVNNLFADTVSVIDTATLTAATTRSAGQPYKAVAAPMQ